MDPSNGQARAWRPALTYIQQICKDTGCSPEDLAEAMNNREEWRERVTDIRAGGTQDDDDDKFQSQSKTPSLSLRSELLFQF